MRRGAKVPDPESMGSVQPSLVADCLLTNSFQLKEKSALDNLIIPFLGKI